MLAAAEPLPEEIADALPALIAYVDAGQVYRFVNKAYESWFGTSFDTLRGRKVRDVVGEAAYQIIGPHIETVLSGHAVTFDGALPDGAGESRRIEARYVPRREGGTVVGYYALILDRSESDRNARHLENILDGIGDGFCAFDRAWRFTYCNQAAEQILKQRRADLIGHDYWETFPTSLGVPLEVAFRRAMETGERLDLESDAVVQGAVLAVSVFPTGPGIAIRFRDVTERHAQERLAREQGQRLELAMAASGLGDWSWDPKSDVVTLSPRGAAIFGIPPGPVMTWTEMLGLLHEEDREAAKLGVEQAVAGRTSYEIEYRIRRPSDGAEVWVLALGNAQYDNDGTPIGMLGVVGDISRSKGAEAALRESEARFRAMADSAPSPVWVTTLDGGVEFVNRAFLEFAGRPAEAMLNEGWISIIHPEDLPQVVERRAAARAKLESYTFEARFKTADGGWKHIQANSRPRFDVGGVFQGYVGMAVDLTEMRNAERALRESEQRFRLAAEDAPVMLWMSDEATECVYLNRLLRDFWGAPEDLSQFDWRLALTPDDRPKVTEVVAASMAARRPFEIEAKSYRADGEVRTLLTRGKPRLEPDGRLVGMIGVHVDVTDVRTAQAHQRLLINELNHRVKNTLATVQSITHQTLREGAVTRQSRDLLTARLLALSAAHNVLTQENWEGASFAQIALEAMRPYEDPAQPRVSYTGPHARLAPNIALALSMALHELATNALKYGALSTPSGRITLNWTSGAEGARIAIEWREEGGPPVHKPERPGFGSRLLTQGLATELGAPAVFDFTPTGLICRFEAPVQAPGAAEGLGVRQDEPSGRVRGGSSL